MESLKTRLSKFLGLKSIKQLTRFLITGTASTAISYLTFLVCLRAFQIHYIAANLIAFLLSIYFNYNCNKRWSFSNFEKNPSFIFRYLALYLFSLLVSTIFLKISVDYLSIAPEIAFILSLFVTTCINFLGIKFLVFRA